MLKTYSQPQHLFSIVQATSADSETLANFLSGVKKQLMPQGRGHLLKERSAEEFKKYIENGAFICMVRNAQEEIVAMSMVAPAKNYADLGRVKTPLNAKAFNGLTEDVINLHNPDNFEDIIDPTQVCVFGAMAIDQNNSGDGLAIMQWPLRLTAAIAMNKDFACTTISEDNTSTIGFFEKQGWIKEATPTIIKENGHETILYRFIATKVILEQNLKNVQEPNLFIEKSVATLA